MYGDQRLYDLRKEYGFDALTSKKINFTGYLDATQRAQNNITDDAIMSTPYVLCVVGGGQDGFHLAETFVRTVLPEGMQGILVTGSMMPEPERLRISQLIADFPEKKAVSFVAEPLKLLRYARYVIAMGGYNTLTEILAFQKSALIVPRVSPRAEQWIRAERLAQAGLIDCVHPQRVTPDFLGHWLVQQHQFANPREKLDFDGLNRVADNVGRILANRIRESESCR